MQYHYYSMHPVLSVLFNHYKNRLAPVIYLDVDFPFIFKYNQPLKYFTLFNKMTGRLPHRVSDALSTKTDRSYVSPSPKNSLSFQELPHNQSNKAKQTNKNPRWNCPWQPSNNGILAVPIQTLQICNGSTAPEIKNYRTVFFSGWVVTELKVGKFQSFKVKS